jgi:hypothetical protein
MARVRNPTIRLTRPPDSIDLMRFVGLSAALRPLYRQSSTTIPCA